MPLLFKTFTICFSVFLVFLPRPLVSKPIKSKVLFFKTAQKVGLILAGSKTARLKRLKNRVLPPKTAYLLTFEYFFVKKTADSYR